MYPESKSLDDAITDLEFAIRFSGDRIGSYIIRCLDDNSVVISVEITKVVKNDTLYPIDVIPSNTFSMKQGETYSELIERVRDYVLKTREYVNYAGGIKQ